MSAPRVSVLILSRGRPKRLSACLGSVAAQDHADLEVCVLANGCPDTARLVREQHPDVRLTELPQNVGCAPGRNRLVADSTGDLLLFLDDDGEIRSRDTVSRLVASLAADPRVGVAGMGLLNAASDEPTGWRRTQGRLPYACYHASFAGGACLVRRRAFEEAGGYSEAFRGFGEEFDLTVRLYGAGWAVLYLPDVCFHHHVEKTDEEWRLQLTQGYQHLQYTIRRLYPAPWNALASWKALAVQTVLGIVQHGGRHVVPDLAGSLRWGRRGARERTALDRRALELAYFAKYYRVGDWETLERAPRGFLWRLPFVRARRTLRGLAKLPLPATPSAAETAAT